MVACHIGWRDFQMDDKSSSKLINRRTVLKMATTAGAAAIVSPRIVMAMGDQPVEFGVDNPLTGTYARTGRKELHGMELAVTEINTNAGIPGRHANLNNK